MSLDPTLLATAALALVSAPKGAFPETLDEVSDLVRKKADADPLQAGLTAVLACTVLFHRAECGVNPKVKSFEDSLVFCTTCMSVGYSDIFAKTPTGKAVASFLHTFGPALSTRLLDAPKRS
ncbi:MAG: two pore domain potassium channel family protein [Deltaproteobacteria bacterium]|nr:two pore domain potassium channel family protein [Deltaproteobacteria bacterium]